MTDREGTMDGKQGNFQAVKNSADRFHCTMTKSQEWKGTGSATAELESFEASGEVTHCPNTPDRSD